MKAKCEICNKQFEQKRTNQVYCSNSCKQKAFKERKVNKVSETDKTIKEKLNFHEFFRIDNSVRIWENEYLSYEDLHFSPIVYFFLIRPFKESNETAKENYIAAICDYGKRDFKRIIQSQAFKDFEHDYLSGKFDIINAEYLDLDTNKIV